MPRIRTIKPETFDDPDLAGVPMLARWVFLGLLTQADRAGRLEDDPRRLKVRLLPFDDADMNAVLDVLASRFITRYEADGHKFIQINTFEKHQRPHPKEAPSLIPAPAVKKNGKPWKETASREITRPAVEINVEQGGSGNGSGNGSLEHGAAEKDDARIDADAEWLLSQYPVWYAEERNGARYMLRPALDAPAAFRVCETWPDRQHVERMCRAFLRAVGLPAAHANRSLEVFARSYASGCDAAVKGGAA